MTGPDPIVSPVPIDRLTELAERIGAALDDSEHDDVRAAIMLDDGHMGGIMFHGYDDQAEALTALLEHMRAVFAASGLRLELVTIPNDPGDLTP